MEVAPRTAIQFKLTRENSPREVARALGGLRSLYTVMYLLAHERLEDCADYAKSQDPKFEEETGLEIRRVNGIGAESVMSAGQSFEIIIPLGVNPRIIEALDIMVSGLNRINNPK